MCWVRVHIVDFWFVLPIVSRTLCDEFGLSTNIATAKFNLTQDRRIRILSIRPMKTRARTTLSKHKHYCFESSTWAKSRTLIKWYELQILCRLPPHTLLFPTIASWTACSSLDPRARPCTFGMGWVVPSSNLTQLPAFTPFSGLYASWTLLLVWRFLALLSMSSRLMCPLPEEWERLCQKRGRSGRQQQITPQPTSPYLCQVSSMCFSNNRSSIYPRRPVCVWTNVKSLEWRSLTWNLTRATAHAVAKAPVPKIAEIPNLRWRLICSFHTMISGTASIATSENVLNVAEDMYNASTFRHFPGTSASHILCRGRQEKILTKNAAK